MAVKGILDGKLWCIDNAGKLILKNVTWQQDANYTFSRGTMTMLNNCTMQGENLIFTYASPLQSIIQSRAQLTLDYEFTFSYAPSIASSKLLSLYDSTARLIMQGATLHSTATGLQLTQGILEIHDGAAFSSDARYKPNGIMLGDGVSSSNNLFIDIFPESKLELLRGFLVYKNLG